MTLATVGRKATDRERPAVKATAPIRVLFVDDHNGILDGYLRAFTGLGDVVPIVAGSGPEALDVLAERPIDVLVTDFEMPLMDGATLLREALLYHPRVARIALSSGATEHAARNLLPLAHQLVAKPFRPEQLLATIRTIGRTTRPPSRALLDLVGSVDKLPSAPAVYQKLTQVMNSPNGDAKAVAEIVRQDPALSARVLQLANSSFFFRGEHLGSVSHAVVRLGLRLVRNLALHTGLIESFDKKALHGFDIDDAVRRAFDAAVLTLVLVQGPSAADTASLAALVADLGHLVLALYRGDELERARRLSAETGRPLSSIERELFGFDHADVGAHLLSLWGLPEPVLRAVAEHHDAPPPTEAGWTLEAAVRLAHLIAGRETIPDAWEENALVAAALPKLRESFARQRGLTR